MYENDNELRVLDVAADHRRRDIYQRR